MDSIETRSAEAGLEDATRAVEELRRAAEQHRAETEQRLNAELRAINERIEAVELRSQRPGVAGGEASGGLETRAFLNFMRRGKEGMPAEEVRALTVSTDTAGGYLAPEQFVAEIVRNLVEISPVRAAARVGQATGSPVVLPKRTAAPTAVWVGETDTRTATAPTYGQVKIEMFEAAAYIDVSNWLLEDSAVDLASELSFDFAEEFGRLEGAAFIAGDGTTEPQGILTDTTVPTVNAGSATALSGDALIGLMYDLPAFYRNRGAWLLNSSTIGAIRKIKDTSGVYVWQESLQAGQPATLLGRPVIEAADMPDIADGETPVVFGDFASAYRIYDRTALTVLRDPYSVATSGLVRFHARRRVGAAVVQAEALRKLVMAV